MSFRLVILLLVMVIGPTVGATAGLSSSVDNGQASTPPTAGQASPLRPGTPVVDPAVLEAQNRRADVIEQAKRSVVAVFASNGRGGGSGVVISPDGLALTNFHVVKPSGYWMKCGMADGRVYDAVLVGLDPTGDIALIQLLGRDDFPAATLGDSDTVAAGGWVYAMGNPFLLATDLEPTVTYGIVSGAHRYQYPAGTLLEYTDCIQTDAAINPGNSGGPLFDSAGRLVGINGRCSFEKRGRVSVGVGYAVSINQIKNFLGCLASGRIVDHATLGFRAAFDADGRVVVDEIQESSDVFRRGLRYGDEIVEFAGRAIESPNALKNALGTFPEGWRLPLVYRRAAQRREILVRLAPLHHESQLLAEMEGPRQVKKPKLPDSPKKNPAEKPAPGKLPIVMPSPHVAPPAPAIVKDRYVKRRGYANYFFNHENQVRVWNAYAASFGEGSSAGRWTIAGAIASGKPFRIELNDAGGSIELPAGRTEWKAGEDLAGDLAPPTSGGLLPALYLWRRLATAGLDHFGEVHYWGAAPLGGRAHMVDVLVGTYGGVACRFYFEPGQSRLVALEMFPDDGADPCEVYFSDYRPIDRRSVPGVMEVRFGDETYGRFSIESLAVEPGPAREEAEHD
jgi:serine protease Do